MSDTGKSKKKGKGKLPEHLEVQRTHVICGPEMNYHVGWQLGFIALCQSDVEYQLADDIIDHTTNTMQVHGPAQS
jgi:hypothetical protein